ncbi:MAG: UvrD-helicase domain-containing protein [Lachnospiraceae bacterium]|nr:UvrD-helicase domain-containing protein [Lachnospiraceae bacterium]
MTDDEKKILNTLENQTRENIIKDYLNNILIEALAGAGKTTILVDRLIIQSKAMDPSKIVAITFTEKAADELKGRFQKKLLEEYDGASDEEKCKLRNAVDHINDIQISTIHSFCNKLLKEMTFEAGLGLDFEVVQDTREREIIKTFFEDFCRDAAQKNDRERLAKAGINAEQLFSAFQNMCYKHGVDEWVYDRTLAIDPNGLRNTLAAIQSKQILHTIYDCLKEDKTVTDKKGRTKVVPGFTDSEIDALGSLRGTDEVLKEPARTVAKYVRKHGSNIDIKAIPIIKSIKGDSKISVQSKLCISRNSKEKTFDDAMLEKSKESYNSIKDASLEADIEDSLTIWSHYLHSICMELLVKAYNAYQDDKKSGGRITNDELLTLTRDMLKNSKTARDFFREEYQYFYIDEYQDTDPIQTEILKLLTATEETIDKSLDEVEFLNGRFCLIGDPKQSIYAFRGADVSLYAKMRAAIESKSNCKLYQMNRNYRSNDEICMWVNSKFKKSDPTDFGFDTCEEVAKAGSTQAGFDNMLSAQGPADTTTYMKGVYKYSVASGNKDTVISEDARHVAHMICNLIDTKAKLSIVDTKTGVASEKEVEPGDFMILTRKKEGIRNYATELKALGIPVLVNGASSISLGDGDKDLGSPLLGFRNLIILSDFVAETNKRNRAYRLAHALVKVFRIKVSPVELFTYCDYIYGDDADIKLMELTDDKIRDALTTLYECVKISKRNPLLAFETLAQKYTALLRSENSREDLVSEVGGLEQILEQIRSSSFGSYMELNNQFKIILQGKNEKELPMGEMESKQAVHIMNAHLAKGLEANIVILACPAYGAPRFQDKVVVEEFTNPSGEKKRRGYVEVILDSAYANSNKYSSITAGISKGFDIAANPVKNLQEEEELRVLYVSGTRPKECLIISNVDKAYAWSDLSEGIADINTSDAGVPEYQKIIALGDGYISKGASTSMDSLKVESQMMAFNAHEITKKKLSKLISIAELSIRPSDQETHSSTDNVDPKYMCGNLYGTMMHKFFELLISAEWKKKLSTSFTEEELTIIIRKSVASGLESERLSQKQCERLKIDPKLAFEDISTQQDELTKHIFPEFKLLGEAILNDKEFQNDLSSAKAIYTEMPFELNLTEDGIKAIAPDIKGGYVKGQEIHVKGTMDLLLELDDRFIIWDYKSDVIKVGESVSALEARLKCDYAPQLRVYEEALKNIMALDKTKGVTTIETKLYHRFR